MGDFKVWRKQDVCQSGSLKKASTLHGPSSQ